MMNRKAIPSLRYVGTTPMRWFQTACAALDDSFGPLCARHWQSAQFVSVRVPGAPRTRHEKRS